LKLATYRLAGRAGGRRPRALIHPNVTDPEAVLAQLVGQVASFEWTGEDGASRTTEKSVDDV
jgi:hypothetical protein